jgi:hypothetical protein
MGPLLGALPIDKVVSLRDLKQTSRARHHQQRSISGGSDAGSIVSAPAAVHTQGHGHGHNTRTVDRNGNYIDSNGRFRTSQSEQRKRRGTGDTSSNIDTSDDTSSVASSVAGSVVRTQAHTYKRVHNTHTHTHTHSHTCLLVRAYGWLLVCAYWQLNIRFYATLHVSMLLCLLRDAYTSRTPYLLSDLLRYVLMLSCFNTN